MSPNSPQEDLSFRAYLFGLARIQLLRHCRKVPRDADLDFTNTSLCDLGTSPTGELARREHARCCSARCNTCPS